MKKVLRLALLGAAVIAVAAFAAGYAPLYAQTPLSAESMRQVRRSLQTLVDAHQPCPRPGPRMNGIRVLARTAHALHRMTAVDPGVVASVILV